MISGNTKIIAHLGIPTESFKAPLILNPWFEAENIDTVVVPMACEPENFRTFLPLLFKLRNIDGALITMPYKQNILDLLDEISPAAKICGACNVVKKDPAGGLIGDIFDGTGFVHGAKENNCEIKGAKALIIGCGGVGSAIATALAQGGLAEIELRDTSKSAESRLAHRLREHFPTLNIIDTGASNGSWDIIVNASPLGMRSDDPLPLDIDKIPATAFVGEVVLRHQVTPFLAAAMQMGCKVQNGLDMLFAQIPTCLEFFGYPKTTPEKLRSLTGINHSLEDRA